MTTSKDCRNRGMQAVFTRQQKQPKLTIKNENSSRIIEKRFLKKEKTFLYQFNLTFISSINPT